MYVDYPALKTVQNLNFTLLIETWPSFSSRLKPALNWNWPFPGPSGRWSGGEGKRCRGFGQIGLEGTSVVIFKRIFLPGFSKRLDLKLVIWAGFPGFDQIIGLKRTSVGIFKCISGSNQYLCPYLIIVIFLHWHNFCENKIYTQKRRFFALNL